MRFSHWCKNIVLADLMQLIKFENFYSNLGWIKNSKKWSRLQIIHVITIASIQTIIFSTYPAVSNRTPFGKESTNFAHLVAASRLWTVIKVFMFSPRIIFSGNPKLIKIDFFVVRMLESVFEEIPNPSVPDRPVTN